MYDFGPLAAQNDPKLLTYFHPTQQASTLIDLSHEKPPFIFVARPGAGKTALLKWLDTYKKGVRDQARDTTAKVISFLINGPADLLSLCNIAGKESGKISISRLEKALLARKPAKWKDVSTYYGAQWPAMDQFAKAMVTALKDKYAKKPIPVGGVNAEFETQFANPRSEVGLLRKKIKWIESAKWGEPPIDEISPVLESITYEDDPVIK